MALLDQYQEDDEENLTTQLLYSIRSWNLDRPSSSMTSSSFDGDGVCDASNNGGSSLSTNTNSASATTATTKSMDGTASTTNNEIVSWSNRSTPTPRRNQHQNHHQAEFKTPCRGNYSSRPSFLTERILEDDASVDCTMMVTTSTSSCTESPQNSINMPLVVGGDQAYVDCNYDTHDEPVPNDERGSKSVPSRVRFLEEEQYYCQQQQHQQEEEEENQCHRQQEHSLSNNKEHTQDHRQIPLFASPSPNNIGPTEQDESCTPQRTRRQKQRSRKQRHTGVGEEKESEEAQDNAMHILLEIANSLGLSSDNVGSVLPTVRKLVRVVKIHVPRLENFVESVCQIVETDNGHSSDDRNNTTTDNSSELEQTNIQDTSRQENKDTSRQNKKKQSKNKKSKKVTKNMEARRKRMSNAVSMLAEEWPKRNSASAKTTDMIEYNTQSHLNKESHTISSPTSGSSFSSRFHEIKKQFQSDLPQRASSESMFCCAVIEKLNQRHRRQSTQIMDDFDAVLESNSDSNNTSIEDALASIDELIKFEERCHKIEKVQKIVTNPPTSFGSPSSAFSPKSPSNSEDIVEELLTEDATTLRKVVLHFAYLFSVRQDEMRLKMNELYHFSHEAGALVDTVRKAVGVSANCPLSILSRRVVDAVHSDCSHGG